MPVNPNFNQQSVSTPVPGGYAQPAAGVTEQIVTAADTAGESYVASTTGTGLATLDTTTGGTNTVAIPATTSANTVVKASAGRLCKVLVTTVGTAAVLIYDNATTNSGTIIGSIAASAAVGTVVDFQMPAANGITVAGSATLPALTISYY